MKEKFELLIHFIVALIKLSKPGGVKALMAKNQLMRQQLIVLNRGRVRAPALKPFDRLFFGFMAFFIGEQRLKKVAIILKPATILKFHKALVQRKYSRLFSNKPKEKPGRKTQEHALIDLVVAMRRRNPGMGYGRIAMQLYEEFGIEISRFAVGRILRQYWYKFPPGDGPSWLTFLGQMKDSLWSVDLFRCESITMRSHWVMVVIDQFTRRIIGFAVHAGDCDGVAYCRMLNRIISGKPLPRYLSSDNDPLFLFHRWQANLRVIDITEIKSIPGVSTSHPFVERIIGSCRRECLDHQLFVNAHDLERKLNDFQKYYNETRAHSSLNCITPIKKAGGYEQNEKKSVSIANYRWRSHFQGLYKLPIAA